MAMRNMRLATKSQLVSRHRLMARPKDADILSAISLVKVISFLMPLVMMRHRRVSRLRWRDQITDNGKHWIEMVTRRY